VNPPPPCSVDVELSTEVLTAPDEGYKTAFNISSVNTLLSASAQNQTFVLLGDQQSIGSNLDFLATTVGVSTQCFPISQECNLTAVSGASTPFYCSSGVNGDLTAGNLPNNETSYGSDPIYTLYFNNSGLTENYDFYYPTNPVYVALLAKARSTGGVDSTGDSNDTALVDLIHGGVAFILFCNVTVYDVEYSYVNGSVSIIDFSPSNNTVAGIIDGPMMELNSAYYMLTNAAEIAVFANTSQGLADYMALAYSQASIGFASGVFSPRTNEVEQSRNTLLVSRVLKSSLYLLVGLNVVFAVSVFVIAICAWGANHSDEGVREVEARLNVWGLAAQAFEQSVAGKEATKVEDLFSERNAESTGVISLAPDDEGKWRFRTLGGN
jgi:hypothetical protein